MIDEKKSLAMLEGFESHYDYDASYMRGMLKNNPKAYATFEAFLPMSVYIDKSPNDAIFVARLIAMKNEDCGACLELNIKMAKEAGVNTDIIKDVLFNEGKSLSDELKTVYDFSLKVSKQETIENELYEKINSLYTQDIIVELALAIAATKVFPSVKRVLNVIRSCSNIKV